MEVGGQTETVTVSGEKPLLQTERADVSAPLDAAQVTNLPISGNGRNFQQLYKLIPGASTPVELSLRRRKSATLARHQLQRRVPVQ